MKTEADERAMDEWRLFQQAADIHEKLGRILQESGLTREAARAWRTASWFKYMIHDWEDRYEWPSKGCEPMMVAATHKDNPVQRWQQLLRDHAGMSGSVAADVAKNLLRSNRDLKALARQKKWLNEEKPELSQIDGTDLMIGILKIKKVLGYSQDLSGEFLPLDENDENGQILAKLEDLADYLGVAAEPFKEAKDAMLGEELEEDWAKYASLF